MASSSRYSLPMRVLSKNERTDPIRVGYWSQSLHTLMSAQNEYAKQCDLFKLAQVVLIQAYGGFGMESMSRLVSNVYAIFFREKLSAHCILPKLNDCYLKWCRSSVTDQNMTQFLIDLYNTCEIIVQLTKTTALDQSTTFPVTEYVNLPELWSKLFPAHLALPIYSDVESVTRDLREIVI